MNLIFGDEIFRSQRVGGISRIFRSIIPLLRGMDEIEGVLLFRNSRWGLPQPFSESFDGVRGVWIDARKRPYRLRNAINKKVLLPFNRWHLERLKDLVYVPTYYSNLPARIHSVCFVYDMIHEMFPDSFSPDERSREIERKRCAIRSSSRCLCISETTKMDLARLANVDADRCDVVYLGGGERKDLNSISETFPLQQSSCLRILYVGETVAKYKNFSFLLSALSFMCAKLGLSVEFNVVTKSHSYSTFAATHIIPQNIKVCWHYMAADQTLNMLYQYCDVFVYPSLWEGFGIPIVEALSWGCPVVCSDIAVFREIAEGVVDFFDPRSDGEFILAMSRALDAGRTAKAVNARTNHAAQFTWENCAKKFLASAKKCL